MELGELVQKILAEPNRERTLIFGPGLTGWREARDVPQVAVNFQHLSQPGAAPPAPPPLSYQATSTHDVIDYEIFGHEMQYVQITLDPGEMVTADAGAMLYMTSGIQMNTVFGDPSQQQGGFLGKIMTAGKRVMTGESMFITTFTNVGAGPEQVGFSAPFPGKIVPLDITQLGGEMICQKHSFLCAARGVSINIAFQRKLGVGFFGGEGFIMQRLTGNGIALVHAGGTLMQRKLGPGETLRIDTGCLVAITPTVNYDIQFIGGLKNTIFGGEGVFWATLTGPGEVWIQSLPFSRLAARIWAAAPQSGGKSQEEGSILGSIGSLLDGNNT
jgi:uncharacterized protein (TIGR00266 family)